MLLGSRIMLQRVTEEELRESIRDEHGVSFWDAAEAAGYEPARWRESIHALDNLTGWVEVHIEQGRVLQDTRDAPRHRRGDRRLHPRRPALHAAGATTPARRPWASASTPPSRRRDDRRARAPRPRARRRRCRHGRRARRAAGADQRHPRRRAHLARPALSVRAARRAVRPDRRVRARARRGARSRRRVRQAPGAAGAADGRRRRRRARARVRRESGETFRQMPSGAAHDTQCVASRVPSAMVFVPCMDRLSHTPLEQADTGRRRARRGGRLLRDQPDGVLSAGPPLGRIGIWSSALPSPRRPTARGRGRDRAARLRRALVPRGIWHPQSFSTAALVLAATERVPVCTGIANIVRATPWRRRPRAFADGGFPGASCSGSASATARSSIRAGTTTASPRHMRSYLGELDVRLTLPSPIFLASRTCSRRFGRR